MNRSEVGLSKSKAKIELQKTVRWLEAREDLWLAKRLGSHIKNYEKWLSQDDLCHLVEVFRKYKSKKSK